MVSEPKASSASESKRHFRNAQRSQRRAEMGQASRTTKLLLNLGNRSQGGANSEKRAALDATAEGLTQARPFYLDFFLAHAQNLSDRATYYSEEDLDMRERLISHHELVTW